MVIAREPTASSLKQRFGDWVDARTALGMEKYGEPLTTFNGRSGDLIPELLDFCQYQEQCRMEFRALLVKLADLPIPLDPQRLILGTLKRWEDLP
jgi:hypothetical protein